MSLLSILKSDIIFYCGTRFYKILLGLCFNNSLKLIIKYRIAKQLKKTVFFFIVPYIVYKIKKNHSCDFSLNSVIGKNIKLPHPFCIIIGDGCVIGDNVTIYQGVTLGSHGRKKQKKEYPTIDNNCIIYAGAKLIGGITIGDSSIIGANAVVIKDVPPHNISIGIPAKCINNKADLS